MSNKLVGYHGTTINSAKLILTDQKFIESKTSNQYQQWLGTGVYFFENDAKQAYYFMIKARRCNNVSVLSADIFYDTIFDLTLTEGREVFAKIKEKLKSRLKAIKKKHPERKIMDDLIIDYSFLIEPFDIVRADYNIPKTSYFEDSLLRPIQRQICVKNNECIKNITEVDQSEYT